MSLGLIDLQVVGMRNAGALLEQISSHLGLGRDLYELANTGSGIQLASTGHTNCRIPKLIGGEVQIDLAVGHLQAIEPMAPSFDACADHLAAEQLMDNYSDRSALARTRDR